MKNFKKKHETKVSDNDTDRLKEVNKHLNYSFKYENTSLSHLETISYLGEGTYALVNLAFDHIRNRSVAIKIFDKKTLIVNRRLSNLLVR